jgi:hypothetical protein
MISAMIMPTVLIILSLIGFIWWITLLVDCSKRTFASPSEKALWFIILIFVHIIGAFLYYFMVKRKSV